MILKPAIAPSFLKIGFFGNTKSGKTYTAAKILSQFIAEYAKGSQLAMFDTEPSGGYVAQIVKKITGKELLTITSRSFSDLLEFAELVKKEGFVALLDSATHPWRSLCSDYLDAKKTRVKSAGGREETVKLTLQDWGPIKDIWNKFTEHFVYDPVHWCMCGREGDVWEEIEDEEGNKKSTKTGVKMKTETETGYEPSLLVQMRLAAISEKEVHNGHFAFVVGDRFDLLTGHISGNNPDIEFFRPHIEALSIGGKNIEKSEGKKIFESGTGPNWETIKAQREGVLENIKDDLLLAYPSTGAEDKKAKVQVLRKAFGTSAWTEMEKDEKKFPIEILTAGREILSKIIKEASNGKT